ncbi:MAG: dTDP-4-dehydrorhamnose reductase [Pseudomonadota bacterium]
MTILVFGKTGQVATELGRLGGVRLLGRADADLSDPDACRRAILTARPRAVINAAAYTAVDRAEADEEEVTRVNHLSPGAMARSCAELDIPFVHISTDYVFSGEGSAPWKPADPANPKGAYGRSKQAGEDAVRAAGGCHAILRTSWVFSAHGGNFVKTMLRLSETRDQLSVVSDQIGGPTPAKAIASACLSIAEQLMEDPAKSGTYHFSGAPDVSWHDFARAIFKHAKRAIDLAPIPTSDYPTPAARPLNSRLDCGTTDTAFAIKRPDWEAALKDVLAELEPRK